MTLTDSIAQEYAGLLKIANDSDNSDAMLLSSMIQFSEPCHKKKANFVPIRLSQQTEDMHQCDESPDFWIIKQSKLIRLVPDTIVKGQ